MFLESLMHGTRNMESVIQLFSSFITYEDLVLNVSQNSVGCLQKPEQEIVTGIQTLKKTVGIIQNLGTVLKIKSRILA
jgi:hypothetical protein